MSYPLKISSELQKLAPNAVIELYQLDASSFGGDIYYFHAGTSYLVGEKGAQIFTPNMNGTIIPNSAMAQTNNVVVNVNMENGAVDSKDGNKLGILIGNVVKQELVKQKRAGGLLA